MSANRLTTLITKTTITTVLLATCVHSHANENKIIEQDLIYSTEQMLTFNIQHFLSIKAPHLIPYKESISHWAGFSSISPKILIALMELQTSIISTNDATKLSQPFGALSKKTGFNAQLKDIANQLASIHYSHQQNDKQSSLEKLIILRLPHLKSPQNTIENLSIIYQNFFSEKQEN